MLLLLRGVFVLALIGIWVYCAFDVIRSDGERVRHLHKLVWLVLVLFVPSVGSLAWLLLGRPEPLGSRLFAPRQTHRPPDDSPEFLAQLGDEIRRRRPEKRQSSPEDTSAIEKEIQRLEEELRRRSKEQEGDV